MGGVERLICIRVLKPGECLLSFSDDAHNDDDEEEEFHDDDHDTDDHMKKDDGDVNVHDVIRMMVQVRREEL